MLWLYQAAKLDTHEPFDIILPVVTLFLFLIIPVCW